MGAGRGCAVKEAKGTGKEKSLGQLSQERRAKSEAGRDARFFAGAARGTKGRRAGTGYRHREQRADFPARDTNFRTPSADIPAFLPRTQSSTADSLTE
jgi:hypothetical protein